MDKKELQQRVIKLENLDAYVLLCFLLGYDSDCDHLFKGIEFWLNTYHPTTPKKLEE